jgi:hypothetical protein
MQRRVYTVRRIASPMRAEGHCEFEVVVLALPLAVPIVVEQTGHGVPGILAVTNSRSGIPSLLGVVDSLR